MYWITITGLNFNTTRPFPAFSFSHSWWLFFVCLIIATFFSREDWRFDQFNWSDIFAVLHYLLCGTFNESVESMWNALESKRHMLADWICVFFSLFISFTSFSSARLQENSHCCCVVRNTFVNLCALLLISIQRQILSLAFLESKDYCYCFGVPWKKHVNTRVHDVYEKAREAFNADRWSIN